MALFSLFYYGNGCQYLPATACVHNFQRCCPPDLLYSERWLYLRTSNMYMAIELGYIRATVSLYISLYTYLHQPAGILGFMALINPSSLLPRASTFMQ